MREEEQKNYHFVVTLWSTCVLELPALHRSVSFLGSPGTVRAPVASPLYSWTAGIHSRSSLPRPWARWLRQLFSAEICSVFTSSQPSWAVSITKCTWPSLACGSDLTHVNISAFTLLPTVFLGEGYSTKPPVLDLSVNTACPQVSHHSDSVSRNETCAQTQGPPN